MDSNAPVIRFHNAPDGRRLALRHWETEAPIAEVVFLHGIISHGGWYQSSCGHLASQGFSVHFLDRRGSGLNCENRGDVDRWTTWTDDIVSYLQQLPSGRPIILGGISWGGILATSVARSHGDLLSGLLLSCPGLCSAKAANSLRRFAVHAAS